MPQCFIFQNNIYLWTRTCKYRNFYFITYLVVLEKMCLLFQNCDLRVRTGIDTDTKLFEYVSYHYSSNYTLFYSKKSYWTLNKDKVTKTMNLSHHSWLHYNRQQPTTSTLIGVRCKLHWQFYHKKLLKKVWNPMFLLQWINNKNLAKLGRPKIVPN